MIQEVTLPGCERCQHLGGEGRETVATWVFDVFSKETVLSGPKGKRTLVEIGWKCRDGNTRRV